jgi:hypothetical protein
MRKLLVALVVLTFPFALWAAEDEALELHIFDISALCAVHVSTHAPLLGPRGLSSLGDGFESEPDQALDMDALADLIRETISPACWDEGGDVSARQGSLLIVKCPPAVAREIGEFLDVLSSATARRVRILTEVFELPLEGWPAEGIEGLDPAKISGGRRTASVSTVALEGVPTAVSLTNRFTWLADYDVEITTETAIADPIVASADEGLALDVTAWPTADGSRVLLEVFLQGGKFERPVRELSLGASEPAQLGKVQLPEYGFFAASVSGLVRPGEALAIPIAGPDGVQLALIRVLPLENHESLGPIIPTGAFEHSRTVTRLNLDELTPAIRRGDDARVSGEMLFTGGVEDFMDLVTMNVQPEAWENPGVSIWPLDAGLVFFGPEDLDRDIRAFVERLEEQLLKTVRVEVHLWSVPGVPSTGPREAFEPGEARFVAAGAVTTQAGREAFLVAGNSADHVADHEVEVARGACIPKPVIARTFEGLAAKVTPRFIPGGPDLDVALSLLLSSRTSPERILPGADAIGPLELVQTGRIRLDTTLRIPSGGVYVLDAGPDASAPDRHLALVVRVVRE